MQHATLINEIESWLLDEALNDPDIVVLFSEVCERLYAAGVPVHRTAISWPTLHPLFKSEQIYWRLGEMAELHQHAHSAEQTDAFLQSPFFFMLNQSSDRLRRRLNGENAILDFPILEELAEDGYTDYLMTRTQFRIADATVFGQGKAGILASWTTKRETGFSEGDLSALSRIQKAFAVACHASIQARVMEALADAYLGPTAARQVLSGTTQLGSGDVIKAVVWFSDLRGSTWLSGKMNPDSYLEYLREYYACTAQPVIDEGGEILDFIGDGVLAIFPVQGDLGLPMAIGSATTAVEKALKALDSYHDADSGPPMRFSIALAVGEVKFGNIGVPTRLAFSAIGQVVNAVTKIDDLSKSLGRSVLVTKEIAAADASHWTDLGPQSLKDVTEPVQVFARACEKDRFDPVQLRDMQQESLAG